MYLDIYLFIISLVGMIILLTYKVLAIRAYDKANTNYLHFDPFPKTRLYISESIHSIAVFIRGKILFPFWKWTIKNIIYIARGAHMFVHDIRNSRKKLGDMIDTNTDASGYVQKIIDQKKKIQKRIKKDLKD